MKQAQLGWCALVGVGAFGVSMATTNLAIVPSLGALIVFAVVMVAIDARRE